MDKFIDIEQYNGLINNAKKEYKPVVTNCYIYSSEIEKYIRQGRFLYEKHVGGLLIYIDEVTYYRAYYYWNVDYALEIDKKDKCVAVTHIYNEGKSEKLIQMEGKLLKAGFHMGDLMDYMQAERYLYKKNLEMYLPMAERIFHDAGLEVKVPTIEMIHQIRNCQAQMETIPYYEIPYMSDEEMYRAGQEGKMTCVINKEGKVCAVWAILFPNSTHGWVGILREYRKFSGIAIIQRKDPLLYAEKNNLNMTTAISEANEQSMKFHIRLGYRPTGRHIEFWVREESH